MVNTKSIHNTCAFAGVLAVLFALFFQVSKGGPFRDSNPFGVDPYDAVGSFAFQGALLLGVLTYARALRLCADPSQAFKVRYIRRGSGLVLLAIAITLAVDLLAVVLQTYPILGWEIGLLIALGGLAALSLAGGAAWALTFRKMPGTSLRIVDDSAPRSLTPAEAIDDLWTLVRLPVCLARRRLPGWLTGWVLHFGSDRLFRRLPWVDPRRHPWRFVGAMGLLAGVLLVLAQLREGLPPSLEAGLLLACIFIGSELAAALLGFALLGGYLGLMMPGIGQCE
jgi:hypothetical protein